MTTKFSHSSWSTLAIRAGQQRTEEGEHSDPIFATSSFVFKSAASAAARFAEEEVGNVYSRFTNPTVRAFEQRLAALEGADYCVATASGMAAILTLSLALLKNGDHIIASAGLFGSTVSLFTKVLSPFGVEVTFVPLSDLDAWRNALKTSTRLLFLETPSNPLSEVADLEALAAMTKNRDCLLVVDNCYCTPALQQPLALGADIVVHSATKYLDGQGRCIGGALITRDKTLYDKFFNVLRTAGPTMSPFNAWVFHKGMETLALRMRAHSENAIKLAQWLQTHSAIQEVYYPGLDSSPGHLLARKQQTGCGASVSCTVAGGRQSAWQVIDSTQLISITANLGDVKTTITHPASTTHSRITPEQRALAGIGENLLRVAVGLEDIDDIINDLRQGLDQLVVSERV